jgi:hypothetical protein
MAGNTNNGYRKGAVKDRSQTFNSTTNQYVKRDTTTGKFIGASKTKYKGVTTEKKTLTK